MTTIVGYDLSGMSDTDALGEVLGVLRPAVACLLGLRSPRRVHDALESAGLTIAVRGGARGVVGVIAVREHVRVRSTNRVPLSSERRSPAREAAHAILGVDGMALSVTAVQLGLRPEQRRRNAGELLEFLGTVEPPAIVAASLSESAAGPAARMLDEAYADAFVLAGSGPGETYPVAEPVARHDFVFVDRRLRVVAARVPSDDAVLAAARHRPVVVDIAGDGDGE
jgi:endonuclease/exonuclease/phosphatase family metal-dependent hydrolase